MEKVKKMAERMQETAMRKMSENEQVKAIMDKIEKRAQEGDFSVWIYKNAYYPTVDIGSLRSYMSLQGFHTCCTDGNILISWGWKVGSLLPIEEALYEIAKSIDDHE